MGISPKDRAFDVAWMKENLEILSTFAMSGFENDGRGVVLCDHSVDGAVPTLRYVRQANVPRDEPETVKLIRAYAPAREMVIVLVKAASSSSYLIAKPLI